jgi:hypothetical protein
MDDEWTQKTAPATDSRKRAARATSGPAEKKYDFVCPNFEGTDAYW